MTDQETEDRPVTRRDFNELVQLFKEERAKADADRKERDEERVKAEADRAAEKKERDEERVKAEAEKAAEKKELDEERVKAEVDRKERDEERAKNEAKKVKIEEERADMQKKWDEGKMLEYALIFFKINQGSPPYKQLLHVKAE